MNKAPAGSLAPFFSELRRMPMTYSYKPVFMLALLNLADEAGTARLADITDYCIRFYEERRRRGLIPEKPDSIFAREIEGYMKAAAQKIVEKNPLEAFEKKGFVVWDKVKRRVGLSPAVWAALDDEGKKKAEKLCREALTRYYGRFAGEIRRNPRIRNIIFDMGNVLIRFEPGRYAAEALEDPEEQRLLLEELFRGPEWVAMDRGALDEKGAIEAVCRRLPAEPERVREAVPKLLATWHQSLPHVEGIEALVRDVKKAGYGAYILSNVSRRYHEFAGGLPAIEVFDGQFISADYGLLKPDPAIFVKFCEVFGLEPETCLFIDDAPANVEAATRTGMEGVVFHGDAGRLREKLRSRGIAV